MVSSGAPFIGILTTLLFQVPLYLVWITGIIIAVRNLKIYPKISLYTIIALGILLCETIIFSAASVLIPVIGSQYGLTVSQTGIFYSISGFVRILIATACWGLIIAAIFSCRTKEEYMKSLDR